MASYKYRRLFLYGILGAAIIFGIFLRFTNIENKVYWLDEAFSSLRISGYSEAAMMAEVQDKYLNRNVVFKGRDLLKYQSINSEKTISDVFDSIQQKDPNNTPLYFLIARLIGSIRGNSIVLTNRMISAVCGVLFLVFFYILSHNLLQNSLSAWIGTAIASLSPFFLLYSQEARPYSLFSLTAAVSCYFFFSALKNNNKIHWLGYAISTSFCLYTSILSIFLQASQFLILIFQEKLKLSSRLIRFLISSSIALISFFPWIVNVNRQEFVRLGSLGNQPDITFPEKLIFIFKSTGIILTRLLVDLKSYGLLPYSVVTSVVTALILYAFIKNLRFNFKISITLSTLTIVPLAMFALRDLLSTSGVRYDLNRYFITSYIGIILSLAYLFGNQLSFLLKDQHSLKQKVESIQFKALEKHAGIYLTLLFLVLALEALSCTEIINSITWHSKSDASIPEVAEVIGQFPQPLIMMHPLHVERLAIFSLIHYLKRDTDFILLNDNSETAYIPPGYSNYFLFLPPQYGRPSISIAELSRQFQFNVATVIRYEEIPLFEFEPK